jgi:hypothetical protein
MITDTKLEKRIKDVKSSLEDKVGISIKYSDLQELYDILTELKYLRFKISNNNKPTELQLNYLKDLCYKLNLNYDNYKGCTKLEVSNYIRRMKEALINREIMKEESDDDYYNSMGIDGPDGIDGGEW